jgi:hypothetical protein
MATLIQSNNESFNPSSSVINYEKFVLPVRLGVDPMKHLLVANFHGDPEFEMLEPQLFDDDINGKGLRILRYRKDKKVDIYYQSGIHIDPNTLTVGNGLGDLEETIIDPARFEITSKGVDIDIAFTDKQGRKVELKIREDSSENEGMPFLAPVGNDIKDPKQLFLVYMLGFDFVKKEGTEIHAQIGDRKLIPSSFPIHRNNNKVYFIRYSSRPIIGTLNPPMNKPIIAELSFPGSKKVDNIHLVTDESGKVVLMHTNDSNSTIEITFDPGFPNLLNISDGETEKGKWTFFIEGANITGGTYKLLRKQNIIDIDLDVTQHWKPKELPLSFKLFTELVNSFCKWPSTYRWTGHVDIANDFLMTGAWERKVKK